MKGTLANLARVSIISMVLLLAPIAGYATTDGHHQPTPSQLIPYWVNFVIYIAALTYLLRKPLANFWHKRHSELQREVTSGTQALRQAQQLLATAEARKSRLDYDLTQLRETITEQAQQEAALLKADAQKQLSTILAQSSSRLEAEERRAETSLRHELAEEVLTKTEGRLRETLTPEQDRNWREAMLGSLGGLLH